MNKNLIWLAILIWTLLALTGCAQNKVEIGPEISRYAEVTIQRTDKAIVGVLRPRQKMPADKFIVFIFYDGNDKPVFKNGFRADLLEQRCKPYQAEDGDGFACEVLNTGYTVKPRQVRTVKVELSSQP